MIKRLFFALFSITLLILTSCREEKKSVTAEKITAQPAESDKKIKEEIDKLNTADSLIFQTEKQLKEFGDKIPADKKAPIEKALEELKSAHKNKDLAGIDSAMANLNSIWQSASEEMYKNTQSQSQGAPQQPGPNPGEPQSKASGNDEVTDVDFEEVKEK